jgi:anti-sigma factor RsiW
VSPVRRVRLSVASRHLDAMLSAYADRSLPAATLLACDQHVAICPRCRAAVDAERRLLSSLRTARTPGLSSRLESALLDLAAHAACPEPASGPSPLRVVRRAAPAMHHSPVRAVMLASLAAGASAAAALSLGVSGVASPGASLPVVRLPDPAATTTLATASTLTVLVAGTRPRVPDRSRGWAQPLRLRTIDP